MATDSSATNIFDVLAAQSTNQTSVANSALSAGISFYQDKKYDRAAQSFKYAAALNPALTEAYTYLGYAYSSQGKTKDAISAFKMSLKVDKTQDTLYTTIANLYLGLGQNSDAMKILKDGIKQNKLNTPAYYTLGQLQAQAGDYSSAETNFRQVIRLEPKDGNGYYALGMALNGMGQYDEAITQLQKATSLKKNFEAAYYELGRAYNATGNADKLQEQIDKLNSIGTSTASSLSASLTLETAKPKMYYYNSVDSTLQLSLGPVSLLAVNPDFITPGVTRDVKVSFAFDSEMDPSSIMSATNWSITKASGGAAGIYNNGLYSDKNIPVPIIPSRVSYDSTTRTATLTFSLTQNATGDGQIDPSHLVFKFMGKDQKGTVMDESADQYDGFAYEMF